MVFPVRLVTFRAIPLLSGGMDVTIPFDLLANRGMTLITEGVQGRLDLKGVISRMGIVTEKAFIPFERRVLLFIFEFLEKLLVARMAALIWSCGKEKL
jgi:hypothetical protein